MHWRWLTLGLVILVLDVAAIILHVGIIVVIVLEVVVLAQLAGGKWRSNWGYLTSSRS